MHDRAAMVLGLYERDVLEELVRALRRRSLFIDIGAGDGYFAIGLVRAGLADQSWCFEASAHGRQVIAGAARLNGVAGRVRVEGTATRECLCDLPRDRLADAVVLVDIEGGEFGLLDKRVLGHLRETVIVIELHDHKPGFGPDCRIALESRARNHFDISEIALLARNPDLFSELDDLEENDRWLACSEGRGRKMTWLLLQPRIGRQTQTDRESRIVQPT
ncbi:MAG: hypothetical protein R3D03_23925, partial [Geminicoccaceae bacterium]